MRAIAMAALLAVGACAGGGDAGEAEDWARVERGDLLLGVEVTGALRSVNSDLLGPPAIPELWDYKISFMAPEGEPVRKGQPTVGFDTSQLARLLEEKRNESESVRKQIEKKLSDAKMARRDEGLHIAEAEANLRKAQLKVDRPTDLIGSVPLAQARLDLEQARAEVEYQKSRAAKASEADQAELASLRELRRRADERVEEMKSYIARMTVRAPRDGIVIYVSNRQDMKKKIGDSVWRAEKVLETADLGAMMARGEVDEVDASRIAVGQRVTLRLDAHPDLEVTGRVQTIARTVQRQSAKNPLKVVRLEIALDRTERNLMRPGMRFRGLVETGRIKNTLLVPAEAVFVTTNGPVAFRKTAAGIESVRLALGGRNRDLVEVRAGLAAGDRVSRSDVEQRAGRAARGGSS